MATALAWRSRLHALKNLDFPLLLSVLTLVGAGLLILHSATYHWAPGLMRRQLMWLALGTGAMLFFMLVNPLVWMRYSRWLYGLNVLMLLYVDLFGAERKGAQRWIELPGGYQFQPSELAKLLLILTLASLLVRMGAQLRTPKGFLLSLLHTAIPAFLVFKQPDLGTSIVLGVLWFAMVFLAEAPGRWLALTVVAGALGFGAMWHLDILRDYQKARLVSFLNPEADPQQSGYHILQARIAIGSGQLTGKGYLQGTQKTLRYIPEQHTDFIFVVIGEELGFIGATGFLALYGLFLYRVWRVMVETHHEFYRLVAGGVLTLFLFHLLTNVGMTMGLFPVVGIPLPFVSLGGSMLLASMMAVGLLLGVRLHEKTLQL
ncbi:MAG: rod shape-determining protein RodA [Armatimonadetes bacterium]|nr:rod shape-determining protein RodA [Armatimonadota bacterium]